MTDIPDSKRPHRLEDHLLGMDPMHSHEEGDADHDHDHDDVGGEDDPTTSSLWLQDNITLLSVGIDIGSAGTQVIFSRVHLRRLSEELTSRYFVVGRETVYQSPVALTPYLSEERIDDQDDRAHHRLGLRGRGRASGQCRHRSGDPHRRGAAPRERQGDRRRARGGGRRIRLRGGRAPHGIDARRLRLGRGQGLARSHGGASQRGHRRRHHEARHCRSGQGRAHGGDPSRRASRGHRRGGPAHAPRSGGEAPRRAGGLRLEPRGSGERGSISVAWRRGWPTRSLRRSPRIRRRQRSRGCG